MTGYVFSQVYTYITKLYKTLLTIVARIGLTDESEMKDIKQLNIYSGFIDYYSVTSTKLSFTLIEKKCPNRTFMESSLAYPSPFY